MGLLFSFRIYRKYDFKDHAFFITENMKWVDIYIVINYLHNSQATMDLPIRVLDKNEKC